MAAINAEGRARQRTRELVGRIAGGAQGARLRAQVAAWNPGATTEEVAEAFQEACALAARACRGQSEREVLKWLRTTTHRELGHLRSCAGKRAGRELLAGDVDVGIEMLGPPAPSAEEELLERERCAELQRVTRALLGGLSARQRQIAALHCHGRRRPEIARQLGMTQRAVKRALERIMSHGRAELVELAGHGCESGEALVSRLAFGLASEREVRAAQLHLATCARCGALYEQLDLWREKVAVLLPIPVVAHAHSGLVERAAQAAAERLAWLDPRGTERQGPLREHVVELGGRLRQHASAAYARIADPTPLAGARPGAVAAAVAGCLALGTGATYCVQRGVDPLGDVTGVLGVANEQPRHASHPRRHAYRAPAPAAPTATAAAATSTPAPQATPVATATATARVVVVTATPTAAPAPQEEYEPMSLSAASSSPQRAASRRRQPAAAPAEGPGEFDGP